jgi:hypothetical protein
LPRAPPSQWALIQVDFWGLGAGLEAGGSAKRLGTAA